MKQYSAPNDSSRETRLVAFTDLLLRWNRRVNLIAPADETLIRERHIRDSLQLDALIPDGADRGIDLGSGAGFPGLILAFATGIPFALIEADKRKAAFLREAARVLEAPVEVHSCRIEAATVSPALLITARAVAPLPRLLDLAAPLLVPGGTCLFPKGMTSESELTAAAAQWQMNVERIPSRTAPGGVILRITELHRAISPG
ncbi:MAG: 16S rRNA (guanine(527)-N(7))-methyltransferase RsmG [Acetobacteraceae bacterium]